SPGRSRKAPSASSTSKKDRSTPRSTGWRRRGGSRPNGACPSSGAAPSSTGSPPGDANSWRRKRRNGRGSPAPCRACSWRLEMGFFNRVAWRPRVDREVDDELAFHLEMRTREYFARGMEPAAARREAERRFGDVRRMRAALEGLGHERNRHMQRTEYLSELRQDIAFASRQLVKNPGFTAVAILTLALGIGGTTAIFSAVYAVVLQPLPLADPARLMAVNEIYQASPSDLSAGNYTDAAAGVPAFERISAMRFASFNLSEGTTPERVIGARATATYFDVMGVAPIVGRTFTASEDQPGGEHVVVLSHRLWTRRFGAKASVVGSAIRLNGASHTVVGVMPRAFDLTTDSEELW